MASAAVHHPHMLPPIGCLRPRAADPGGHFVTHRRLTLHVSIPQVGRVASCSRCHPPTHTRAHTQLDHPWLSAAQRCLLSCAGSGDALMVRWCGVGRRAHVVGRRPRRPIAATGAAAHGPGPLGPAVGPVSQWRLNGDTGGAFDAFGSVLGKYWLHGAVRPGGRRVSSPLRTVPEGFLTQRHVCGV